MGQKGWEDDPPQIVNIFILKERATVGVFVLGFCLERGKFRCDTPSLFEEETFWT